MRALVTGCAGFIGSHLVERLVADGWRVTGIDAFTPFYDAVDKEANLLALEDDPAFDLVRADLLDAPLARLLTDHPVVFHLAGEPGVRNSFGDGFNRYVRRNVLATQRVFEAAADARCERIVFASSSSVYGDAERYPCPETAAPRPRSPYGVTKRTCELLADVYRTGGVPIVGLRYFTVYGPRQRPDMAMRRLCEAAAGGPPFQLNGDGQQTRDFTFVDDAVDATVRAASAPDPPPVVNVGGGQEASMIDVIAHVEHLADVAVPLRRGAVGRGDVTRTSADVTLAAERLGWRPTTSLVDGLHAELAWVRGRRGVREPATVGGAR